MAPIIECMKVGAFQWNSTAARAFEEIKDRLINAPILKLSDFEQVFEVV